MLHACLVYIPTCFMYTFIQYLALSGTNLLTRCHSASSYFLLFLYFRKVVQEIFLELSALLNHVTKTVPEGDLRGAARCPAPTQARPNPGPCLCAVWAHQPPPTPPLCLFIPRFGKT